MAKTYFVTGTDTEVGKTFVTCALMVAANQSGKRTLGLKPVAAGATEGERGLENEDALALRHYASVSLGYSQVNPVVFRAPVAPHIAAHQEKRTVSVSRLAGLSRGALMTPHDISFVEGAGGWLVPLGPNELLSDLAVELNLPVIMVVGLRLGCLNHALLTAEAVRRRGCELAGWIGNQCQPEEMLALNENLATLKSALRVPCLGVLPHADAPDSAEVTAALNLQSLF